jgi:ABC-type branched-subunit amino acid transport system ATPase component
LSEIFGLRSSRLLQRKQVRRANALLETFGLVEWADASPTALPSALAKYMDLARAVMSGPGLVLLDEPAAGLNDVETRQLGEVILAIRDSGCTVMVVEHNMSLLFSVADKIVVLDAGRLIATGPPSQVRCDENVIAAYFGSEEVGA